MDDAHRQCPLMPSEGWNCRKLGLGGDRRVELIAERVYQLAATLRIGVTNCPALVNGFIEGGAIEMYNP